MYLVSLLILGFPFYGPFALLAFAIRLESDVARRRRAGRRGDDSP